MTSVPNAVHPMTVSNPMYCSHRTAAYSGDSDPNASSSSDSGINDGSWCVAAVSDSAPDVDCDVEARESDGAKGAITLPSACSSTIDASPRSGPSEIVRRTARSATSPGATSPGATSTMTPAPGDECNGRICACAPDGTARANRNRRTARPQCDLTRPPRPVRISPSCTEQAAIRDAETRNSGCGTRRCVIGDRPPRRGCAYHT